MHTAPPTPPPPRGREASSTAGDMLWEVADLAGGAVVTLLPVVILAVPSAILFLLLPALVILAVAAVAVVLAGAITVPFLLTRSLLRGRSKTHRRSMRRNVPIRDVRRSGHTYSPTVTGGASASSHR